MVKSLSKIISRSKLGERVPWIDDTLRGLYVICKRENKCWKHETIWHAFGSGHIQSFNYYKGSLRFKKKGSAW